MIPGNHNPTHRTVPSLAFVKSLYNKDSEQFHRLTNSDIEKMAEIIATKVIDYDFNRDFVEHSLTVIDRVKTKDDLDRVNQQFEFGYHKAFKIDKVEASRELLQKGLGELTINDVKQQRMIAYVENFDGFTHDMMFELENSSVWVNNERTNDYTQQAAHTNTTYSI